MAERKKLRDFRIALGMTQERFSEYVGYSKNQYSRIERGENSAGDRFIAALSKRCGLSIDEARELVRDDG